MAENCIPNPEVVKIIQAMARNRAKAGMTDPMQIIDAIHADIEPHTGLWKSEIADAIVAVTGKPRELSPAAQRVRDMKAELRDLQRTQEELRDGGSLREAKRIAAKESRLQSEVDDLNRRVAYEQGAPDRRERVPDSAESSRLIAERDRLKDILRRESNPPAATKPADIHEAVNKRVASDARRRIEEIDAALANGGKLAEKTPLPRRLTQQTRDLIALRDQKAAELAAIREEAAKSRTAPTETGMSHEPKQAPKDRARQKQLQRDIAKLESGDYSKAARSEPYPYNEETRKLEARREVLRQQADHELQRIEYSNRTPFRKGLDLGHSLMRAAILSGIGTIEHLAGASLWRAIAQIVGDAADAGMRAIPAYRRLSDAALVEGGGFQAGSHLAGAKRAFSKETLKIMRDKITKGMSERAALYKDAHYTAHPLLDLIGNIHDVVKTPIEQYAYARALSRQSNNIQRTMREAGASDAQIQKALLTDSAQATMNARAYAKSQEAKLQGKNGLAEAYSRALEQFASKGDFQAALAAILKFETPIVKIPLNYAAESLSYMGGSIKAASDLRALRKAARDARVEFKLTPEQADKIVLNLKNQTVGMGAMALGFLGYEHFGGLYRAGQKQPNRDIDTEDAKFGDVTVSHHLTHSPLWNVMQAGALAHYAFDEDQRKARDHSELRSVLEGSRQALLAVLLDVPFSNIPKDMALLAAGSTSAEKLAGEKVAQYIPAPVKEVARYLDKDSQGEPVKRKPKNFMDEIKAGIPGYREEVPRK
jgi:hypothetical protein